MICGFTSWNLRHQEALFWKKSFSRPPFIMVNYLISWWNIFWWDWWATLMDKFAQQEAEHNCCLCLELVEALKDISFLTSVFVSTSTPSLHTCQNICELNVKYFRSRDFTFFLPESGKSCNEDYFNPIRVGGFGGPRFRDFS